MLSGGATAIEREERAGDRREVVPHDVEAGPEPPGPASKQFVPTDGLEVVLDVRPATAALLQLVDAGQPIRWPSIEPTRVEAADGSPALVTRGSRDGRFWIGNGPPGRHRVLSPAIEGYRPLEPIDVELVEGRTIELTVPLERIP